MTTIVSVRRNGQVVIAGDGQATLGNTVMKGNVKKVRRLYNRMLRKLEALLAVADENASLIITGNGDVVQPENDLIAIGSGGPYAQAAARALLENTDMNARDIAVKALDIAGDICIYTNHNHTIEELPSKA